MKNKNTIAACLLACLTFIPAGAKTRFDLTNSDLGVIAGLNLPMYKNLGGDFMTGITFGHFNAKGIGFRTGIQFSPTSTKYGNAFAVPLAFSYRVTDRYGNGKWGNNATVRSVFKNVEFMAGLTPGYVPGKYTRDSETESGGSWAKTSTKCDNHFSTSIDAGMSLNYSIWRFDLKVMPAFHYNLTDNYRIETLSGSLTSDEINSSTKPVKWFFSLYGGIVFRF